MNAVEIEEAISRVADSPFEPENFPFAFLEAFGNKDTTIKRLRSGATNQSDVLGGVLQRSNIHIKVCAEGQVTATLDALRQSPATSRQKAKFILATDGKNFEAENIVEGETVACAFADFSDHFGFFLPLAGITTVKQIRENAFDIKATGRLNRLYIELLRDNPDWGTEKRRHEMNHFMARLIFCFFAEDTAIFGEGARFTNTIETMSARDSSNTHEVVSELFRAMNTKFSDRGTAGIKNWANGFPYVNGGLFSDSVDVPRFSKIARSYLIHVGKLDWTKINPDIFGSMIQAVADDEERGALGMHYTSVPNILKVLNPLFLDELRAKLQEAGDNPRKLLNLRQRITRIRVFDPACGSGNFLVIAYKEMRAIEAEINRLRNEADRSSEIPLTNFRGIELRDFPAEIARLALIIAEYQCDVLYRGQTLALAEFLPLEAVNWITCGNALRLDWLSICPPTGTAVRNRAEDLFSTPLNQPEIDFENEGGETYICGNPPYIGDKKQNKLQKADIEHVLAETTNCWKSLDYICGFIYKAYQYAFVSGKNLNTYHLEGSYAALNALNTEQFPLYAKVHGDFRYQSIKNLSADLAKNDVEIQKCFLAGATRYGIIVSGYSGRDANVMAMFRAAIEQNNAFPHGLYWTVPSLDSVQEPVKNLIAFARSKGINAFVVATGTFDIMLSRLWRQLPKKPEELQSKVQTVRGKSVSIPLPPPGKSYPILRTNALPVLQLPHQCAVLETKRAFTYQEINDRVFAQKPDAVFCSTDKILFWGDSKSATSIFDSKDLSRVQPYSFSENGDSPESSTILKSFFENSLAHALCQGKPLKLRRKARQYFAVVDHDYRDDKRLLPLKQALGYKGSMADLTGSVPRTEATFWAEAVSISLEYRNDAFWLMLEPDIWISPLQQRENAIEVLRTKKLKRYNSQASHLLSEWITLLLGSVGERDVDAIAFEKSDFPALFKINARTAFSYKGGPNGK